MTRHTVTVTAHLGTVIGGIPKVTERHRHIVDLEADTLEAAERHALAYINDFYSRSYGSGPDLVQPLAFRATTT